MELPKLMDFGIAKLLIPDWCQASHPMTDSAQRMMKPD